MLRRLLSFALCVGSGFGYLQRRPTIVLSSRQPPSSTQIKLRLLRMRLFVWTGINCRRAALTPRRIGHFSLLQPRLRKIAQLHYFLH